MKNKKTKNCTNRYWVMCCNFTRRSWLFTVHEGRPVKTQKKMLNKSLCKNTYSLQIKEFVNQTQFCTFYVNSLTPNKVAPSFESFKLYNAFTFVRLNLWGRVCGILFYFISVPFFYTFHPVYKTFSSWLTVYFHETRQNQN